MSISGICFDLQIIPPPHKYLFPARASLAVLIDNPCFVAGVTHRIDTTAAPVPALGGAAAGAAPAAAGAGVAVTSGGGGAAVRTGITLLHTGCTAHPRPRALGAFLTHDRSKEYGTASAETKALQAPPKGFASVLGPVRGSHQTSVVYEPGQSYPFFLVSCSVQLSTCCMSCRGPCALTPGLAVLCGSLCGR